MSRGLVMGGCLALVLASAPFIVIARIRSTTSPNTRIHVFPDMDNQPKHLPQSANPLFVDGRAMRPQIEGTVARGELQENDHLYRGKVDGRWARSFPMPVTDRVIERGQQRFNIYCAPCHGLDGGGNGPVNVRAEQLLEGTWTTPSSYHTDLVRGRSEGELFNTITHGIRNMPSYAAQIPVEDRWAIVAYVRALQRSRRASIEDAPAGMRAKIR